MQRVRRAYTLMEVVIVMAILVVVTALAFPIFDNMYTNSRLNAAGDMVRARWTEIRARALEDRRPYRFAIKDNTGRFRVAPDTAEFWPDAEQAGWDEDRPPLVVEGSLPDQVYFCNDGGAGSGLQAEAQDWRTLVTFLPDGTASSDVQVSFASPGSRAVTLILRSATGTVTTAELPWRQVVNLSALRAS